MINTSAKHVDLFFFGIEAMGIFEGPIRPQSSLLRTRELAYGPQWKSCQQLSHLILSLFARLVSLKPSLLSFFSFLSTIIFHLTSELVLSLALHPPTSVSPSPTLSVRTETYLLSRRFVEVFCVV